MTYDNTGRLRYSETMKVDLVLSSGFLAFARQAGFLAAVETSDLEVDGICGTSSGALAGSLWAAGMSAAEIARELSAQAPIRLFRPSWTPWRGLMSLGHIIERLRDWLPPTFADLARPFGVGVRYPDGSAGVLTSGPLPEAVAASCAIPGVFTPVCVAGVPLQDGGVVCRTGLDAWRATRDAPHTLLHLVDRSGNGAEPVGPAPEGVCVVRTPRSQARFWDLGDFLGQMDEARRLASDEIAKVW
jgi:predicted acylesterase/phospholipase RssA